MIIHHWSVAMPPPLADRNSGTRRMRRAPISRYYITIQDHAAAMAEATLAVVLSRLLDR